MFCSHNKALLLPNTVIQITYSTFSSVVHGMSSLYPRPPEHLRSYSYFEQPTVPMLKQNINPKLVQRKTAITLATKLQKRQNRAARIVTFSSYDANADPLDKLCCGTFFDRRYSHMAIVVHKSLHDLVPDYLRALQIVIVSPAML